MLVGLRDCCRVWTRKLGWLGVLLTGYTLSVIGAKPGPHHLLTPEGVLQIRKPDNLQICPDGRRVAFTLEEPIQGTAPRQNIWILDLETRESRQFTTARAWESQPRWRPDGRALAFLSNRSGKPQVYVIPTDGGEAEALTRDEKGVGPFAWSPDGTRIAYVAQEPDTEGEKKRAEEKDDAQVVRRNYYSRAKDDQFWVVDTRSREVRQVTQGAWRFSNGDTSSIHFTWSPAGDRLLVSATSDPRPDVFTSRLVWVRVSDGKMEELAAPRGAFSQMRASPDGKTIAYLATREDGPQPEDLFVQSVDGGQARNLTGDTVDRRIKCFEWLKDGTLMVLAETGFTSALYRCSLDGKVVQLNSRIAPATHWGYGKSFTASRDAIVFVAETSTRAPELWLKTGREMPVPLTRLNAAWQNVPLRPLEVFRYRGAGGLEIEAGILKPSGRPAPIRWWFWFTAVPRLTG